MAVISNLRKCSHKGGLGVARLVLLVTGGFSAAGAKDVHTNLAVSVEVRAVAQVELESAPDSVDLTAADLERGFIDIVQPTQLVVRSNSAQGYALDVLPVTGMAASMLVSGMDSAQSLGADGGTLVQRWQSPHSVRLALRFRFGLAPGLTAGRYPWPVRVSVRPLESI